MSETKPRRRWTVDEKHQVLKEASHPGMTVSFVARKYGIAPSLIFRWRRWVEKRENEPKNGHGNHLPAEVMELKRQIHALERLVGKKTLENELLKEALTARSQRRPHANPP